MKAAACIQRQWRRHRVLHTLRGVGILAPNETTACSKNPRVLQNTLEHLKRVALDHYCKRCDCATYCPRASHDLFCRLMQPSESHHYAYPICRAFWSALLLPKHSDRLLVESAHLLADTFCVGNLCVWGTLCGYVSLHEAYHRQHVAFLQRHRLHQIETLLSRCPTAKLEDARTLLYRIIKKKAICARVRDWA